MGSAFSHARRRVSELILFDRSELSFPSIGGFEMTGFLPLAESSQIKNKFGTELKEQFLAESVDRLKFILGSSRWKDFLD